jgi:hypothetical protein
MDRFQPAADTDEVDAAKERIRRRLAMLEEFAEIGMKLARASGEKALAKRADEPAEAEAQADVPAGPVPSARPHSAAGRRMTRRAATGLACPSVNSATPSLMPSSQKAGTTRTGTTKTTSRARKRSGGTGRMPLIRGTASSPRPAANSAFPRNGFLSERRTRQADRRPPGKAGPTSRSMTGPPDFGRSGSSARHLPLRRPGRRVREPGADRLPPCGDAAAGRSAYRT